MLEQANSEDSKEHGHHLKSARQSIHFVHWVHNSDRFGHLSQTLQHSFQLVFRLLLSVLVWRILENIHAGCVVCSRSSLVEFQLFAQISVRRDRILFYFLQVVQHWFIQSFKHVCVLLRLHFGRIKTLFSNETSQKLQLTDILNVINKGFTLETFLQHFRKGLVILEVLYIERLVVSVDLRKH